MRIWKWLERFRERKRDSLNQKFAEKITRKYEWKSGSGLSYVMLRHRRAKRSATIIRQIHQRQIEQMIQKYMPKTIVSTAPVIQRRERTRLLSVLEDIHGQGGEQQRLEQLIFRRKEREWKKTVHLHEEAVSSLRQELLQQKKIIETLEKKVTEPVIDTGKLYTEFRKKMEQQLRLERQRAGL